MKKREPKIHFGGILEFVDQDGVVIRSELAPICVHAQDGKQYMITKDWTQVTCKKCCSNKRGIAPGIH